MEPRKIMAYLHSKKVGEKQGEQEEVTLIGSATTGNTTMYTVVTESGIKCSAIFNPFTCTYYADDVYGVLSKWEDLA